MTAISSNKAANNENFTPPDGGWGWVIVFSSFMIHLIMDGITYSLGTYLNVFTDFFNVSHGAASVIHALLPAVTLGSGPIASIFTNRYGCRLTTFYGAIVAGVGFILAFVVNYFTSSPTIISLYITIGIIVGIGFGLVYVPAIVSVGFYFEKKRSFAIGIAVCGTGAGTFLLSPLNRILIDSYGWEGAFLIKAAFCFNICVCGMVMRPVSIEPSEILKEQRRLKKLAKNSPHQQQQQPIIQETPQIVVVDVNNQKIDNNNNNNETNSGCGSSITDSPKAKSNKHDSLPLLYNKENTSSSDDKNRLLVQNATNQLSNNNGGHHRVDVNEFAISLPMIVNNNSNDLHSSKSSLSRRPRANTASSKNSSLDIMAHVRSLQNIPISSSDDQEKDSEKASTNHHHVVNSVKELNRLGSNTNITSATGAMATGAATATNDEEIGAGSGGGCMKGLIDVTLFADVIFMFFAVSNFLTSLGFNAPFIYIVDQAIKLGITETNADWLLSTIGISNTVGRVVLGLISDNKKVNRLFLYAGVLTICGLATMIEPFLSSFTELLIYSIVFGFTSGNKLYSFVLFKFFTIYFH